MAEEAMTLETIKGPDIPAWKTFEEDYGKLIAGAARLIDQMDPADAQTLHFAIVACIRLGIRSVELANVLGVTKTHITRWVKGEALGRDATREVYVQRLRVRLDGLMKQPIQIKLAE